MLVATFDPINKESSRSLNRSLVKSVLSNVIARHPRLWLMLTSLVDQKDGRRYAWEGRLSRINLDDCVVFEDIPDDSPSQLIRKLESLHDTCWFDTNSEKELPLWKVVVLNSRHVVLIYHHAIADGMGARVFLQDFLGFLNKTGTDETTEGPSIISAPEVPLPPNCVELLSKQAFGNPSLKDFLDLLWVLLLGFVLRSRDWAFTDATYDNKIPKLESETKKRTRTGIIRRQIPMPRLQEYTQACREHKVTFTSLLTTLFMASIAELYPKSKYGIISTQVSNRRYLLPEQQSSEMNNIVGNWNKTAKLPKYRLSANPPKDTLWNLVRGYNTELNTGLSCPEGGTPTPVANVLSLANNMPQDETRFYNALFPMLGKVNRRAFCISNLGLLDFNGNDPHPNKTWEITDVINSGSAQNPAAGFLIGARLSSLKGNGCSISINWQRDALKREVASSLIDRVLEKLDYLIPTKLEKFPQE